MVDPKRCSYSTGISQFRRSFLSFFDEFCKKTRADLPAIRASLPAIRADLPELHFLTCLETVHVKEQIRPDDEISCIENHQLTTVAFQGSEGWMKHELPKSPTLG